VCTGHVRWVSRATAPYASMVDCKSKQWSTVPRRVRAAKSEVTGHVRCATGLSGAAKGQRVPTVNNSKPQRARWRGAHRTANSDCLVRHRTVRCAHRHQRQPTAREWLEAINTPQPPLFKASKHSEVLIHCKSKVQHSKTQSKHSTHSKLPKSTLVLKSLREDYLCSFVALVAWIAFSSSHSYF
jgi:hypothetical protein